MTTKQFITSSLFRFKNASYNDRLVIPVKNDSKEEVARLELIVADQVHDNGVISSCAKWRQEHEWWFPKQFHVTLGGTKKWLEKGVIEAEDRVLFFIVSNNTSIGHIGLYRFNYDEKSCELDNVLRGKPGPPGVMTYTTQVLMEWAHTELRLSQIKLRVFQDNRRALTLYERVGFHQVKLIPLQKKLVNNEVIWEEDESSNKEFERAYVLMEKKF